MSAVTPIAKLRLILDSIRFEHTIFALPFAYLGMVLAADGLPTLLQFLWITVAMASARTLAMSANRIIDRHIDALSPRTAALPLPDASAQELRALLARRCQLVEMLTAEKNRFRTATRRIRPQIQEHIHWLQRQLEGMDGDLGRALRERPVWCEKEDLLRSVPGVGPVLSLPLLADLPELGTLDRRPGRRCPP